MDKIFVSDFIKEVEIGAFQSERGCTQQIKFNVCLELKALNVQLDDNVDKLLSYEIITDAINAELSSQRFNLLETLAEKVADRCLLESRVTRAIVKIEKLDRIPGSLGVCISRDKEPNKTIKAKVSKEIATIDITLVSFSNTMTDTEEIKSWLLALLGSKKKVTILVDPFPYSVEKTFDYFAMSQVALLGMEQDAWRISCFDERLTVVRTRSELYQAAESNRVTFFCPSYLASNSVGSVPDLLDNYDKFLAWFSMELGIKKVCLIGRDENKLKTNDTNLSTSFFKRNDWNYF